MAEVQRVGVDEIVDYFDELEDPRSPTNLKHPLVSVVVLAILLSSAEGGCAESRSALGPRGCRASRQDVRSRNRRAIGVLPGQGRTGGEAGRRVTANR